MDSGFENLKATLALVTGKIAAAKVAMARALRLQEQRQELLGQIADTPASRSELTVPGDEAVRSITVTAPLLDAAEALLGHYRTVKIDSSRGDTQPVAPPREPIQRTGVSRGVLPSADTPVPRGLLKAKAEGRWRTRDGEDVVLRSGRGDEWWHAAEQFARARGLIPPDSRASLDLSKHVEIKLAMRMRTSGSGAGKHEVLRMDREVCGTLAHQSDWALTCDKQLATYLPPGTTLTVIEPDGTRRVYTGDEDPA
ncbi:DddA-like double-stranded DNA deaminase toxin [Amycolatopsis samaneae]|uniref:DddA-like double-stranded DNA deaminase toxin n=1 Tax=Amycolatopsis samaneae TaxID=664691 RepID=A0ABW5GF97_9PSEU